MLLATEDTALLCDDKLEELTGLELARLDELERWAELETLLELVTLDELVTLNELERLDELTLEILDELSEASELAVGTEFELTWELANELLEVS